MGLGERIRMADEDDDRVVRLSRMEAFNDGVFRYCYHPARAGAFSAGRSEGQLLSAVLSLWPSYLAYIVSFATIGATWLEHNSVTHYMHGANTAFLRLNLALLLVVSFLPFPQICWQSSSSRGRTRKWPRRFTASPCWRSRRFCPSGTSSAVHPATGASMIKRSH
jgi:hypothetical protein